MTTRRNGFASQTTGQGMTVANSANSGDPITSQVLNGGTQLYDSSNVPPSASMAVVVTPASTLSDFFEDASYATLTMVDESCFYYAGAPSVNNTVVVDFRDGTSSHAQLVITSAGKFAFVVVGGATVNTQTNALVAGHWYRYSARVLSDATAGTVALDYYLDNGTSSVEGTKTASSQPTRGGNMTLLRRGCVTGSQSGSFTAWRYANLQSSDGTTALGQMASPPTAAFTYTRAGLQVTVDGVTSVASGAPITNYAFNFGDGGTTSGAGTTAAHTYASGGSYTVTLTVTDSNGLTGTATQSIVVSAPTGSITIESVNVSTNWVASSGTALAVLTDGDNTTFVTSQTPPTGQELDFTLKALTPPAAGQPLKVFITMDALLASSATVNAQLVEVVSGTQRSSLSGVTIPSGAGSAVTGLVTLTFPYSDVSAVSTSGWNALKVKLQVTAA